MSDYREQQDVDRYEQMEAETSREEEAERWLQLAQFQGDWKPTATR